MTKEDNSILILDNSVAITGALKAIIATSEELSLYNRFIFLLPTNSSAVSYIKAMGFEVFEVPFKEISKRIIDLITYLPFLIINTFRINRIIRMNNVRLIHINDFYNMLGISAFLLNPHLKLITHIRILPDRYPLILRKLWLAIAENFSSSVLCMSQSIKAQLNPKTKCKVIYDMPLKSEEFPPPSIDSSNHSTIKLLYLSNYINGKGQNYAIEAFAIALNKNKRLRLTFVGGDMGLEKNRKFKDDLVGLAQKHNVLNFVLFKDFHNNVEQLIKSFDIMLNFSESESFSMTCLESLYYGTPLIATDSGGPAELFEHGKSGHLVPNRDVQAMAKAIILLANRLDIREKYSSSSRIHIRKTFNISDTVKKLNQIYNQFQI